MFLKQNLCDNSRIRKLLHVENSPFLSISRPQNRLLGLNLACRHHFSRSPKIFQKFDNLQDSRDLLLIQLLIFSQFINCEFQLFARIKSHIVTPDFDAMVQAISDIREWKRPLVSICALIGWLLFVNFFQLWVSLSFFKQS